MYVDSFQLISNQESMTLSPDMGNYDLVVPKDNMLHQMNELINFSFILLTRAIKEC
ncbi:hypothetical protein JCM9140_1805 [Halalkalibacter wakoensis JCM 9140]|uniref:Uncharacterized protein n=1 Tax=Halalkalibacter wakoensis JCM 9140 TaxID=1236970 RepID=W4Q340_9BACI|nr:hypothetical protein JCM9140_1805 [Halalkalibacter wakoensis JCM 9140]